MITLYNVISADGYITERDGSEDFIPDGVWQDFIDICKKYDTVIIGRKTYDALQGYDQVLLHTFENLPVKKIVVTTNTSLILKKGYIRAYTPEDAIASGTNILVSSGPTLNTYLLTHELIDRVILNKLSKPSKTKSGLKPFDIEMKKFLGEPISQDVKEGRKILTYRVSNAYFI